MSTYSPHIYKCNLCDQFFILFLKSSLTADLSSIRREKLIGMYDVIGMIPCGLLNSMTE